MAWPWHKASGSESESESGECAKVHFRRLSTSRHCFKSEKCDFEASSICIRGPRNRKRNDNIQPDICNTVLNYGGTI